MQKNDVDCSESAGAKSETPNHAFAQKDNTDKSRKAHPVINIGDKVWLLRRNLKTNCPCDKLDFHRLGPFLVVK
jgi:hypothetical protein